MIDFATGRFSEKALDFIRNSDARLNITHGSVRSSKTVNCTVRWLVYLFEAPVGDLIMVGKTIASLQRNVLNDMRDLIGPKYFHWVDRQKGELKLFGRRVHIVGANTAESEERIRGSTLAGALCDEASLYPQSFMDMLMTRLSVRGAKCFCTCNPDTPTHWFHQNYIQNDKILDRKIWHFTLDDNPNLDKDYVEALKQQFTGVFYDRFILGLWVVATGAIYRKFVDNPTDYILPEGYLQTPAFKNNLLFSTIGVDFGGSKSAHTFNCTGIKKGFKGIITLDELYHRPVDHEADSQWDGTDLTLQFVKFVTKQHQAGYKIKEIYVDSEEQVLKKSFERALRLAGFGFPVLNARKRAINERIKFYNSLFGFGPEWYSIAPHCKHTIDAFKSAMWDPDKQQDVRLDDGTTNIDNLDSQEYTTEAYQVDIVNAALHRARQQAGTAGKLFEPNNLNKLLVLAQDLVKGGLPTV